MLISSICFIILNDYGPKMERCKKREFKTEPTFKRITGYF